MKKEIRKTNDQRRAKFIRTLGLRHSFDIGYFVINTLLSFIADRGSTTTNDDNRALYFIVWGGIRATTEAADLSVYRRSP
jgi:hypothetical protein